jgi:tetratricopeptide (TPR) repeat protein
MIARVLAAGLSAIAVAILSGCGVSSEIRPEQSAAAVKPMSVAEARRVLRGFRGHLTHTTTIMSMGSTYPVKNVLVRPEFFVVQADPRTARIEFAKLDILSINRANFDSSPAFLELGGNNVLFTGLGPRGNQSAERLASAVYALKQAAMNAQRTDTEFERVAQDFRAGRTLPEFPEEARRFRVQAESAVREKRFEAAADLYEEALGIAPWWPEGHFNQALVLAETGDFRSAVRAMNRYLKLSPNAPDSRAARDKVYEWEAKFR